MAMLPTAGIRGVRAVRIDGLTEALAALRDLDPAFRAVAAASIRTGAGIIEDEAHSRVPKDEGDLDRSIGTNIREDGLQASVGAGDYKARYVEFGTEDTPSQPYLFPAFKRGARFVRKEMRTWAKEAVQKVRFKTKRFKPAAK
jgi:HK97 gp10 family phage protein